MPTPTLPTPTPTLPTPTLPTPTPSASTAEGTATTPADLLRRAAAGDADAWAAIVARYTPVLRGRVRRYRLQDADAQDVIQVTWLRLAQHLDRIHTPEHLAGWLAAVANRECLRVLRDRARTVVVPDVGPGDDDPGPEQVVVDEMERAELRAAVTAALTTLPARRRELLEALFADDGRSYARIAHDVGMPVGSIGPTRARVLAHLRRLVERRTVRSTDPAFVGAGW